MGSHTDWGHASSALYTLHPAHRAGDDIQIDDDQAVEGPWVLGLWTENGDGLALEGTSAEIQHYLRMAVAHVERATKQEGLPAVLAELVELRQQREELLDGTPTANDLEVAAGLDAHEVDLLCWIAEATAQLLDYQP